MILPNEIRNRQVLHPLTRHLHPTHIGAFHKATMGIDRPNGIDTHILIMCVDGCGFIKSSRKHVPVPAGSLALIPANKPHAYGAEAGQFWTIDWVHFTGTLAPDYYSHAGKGAFVMPMPEKMAAKAKRVFEDLHATLLSGFHDSNQILASQQLAHLLGILFFSSGIPNTGRRRTVAEEAITFMSEFIDSQLTLQEIADELGYSKTHFSALFKQETGHAPIDYFIHMKISHACGLLDTTSLRIGEVGAKVGIPNPYYFSRLFSKIMGIAPRRYRGLPKG